jgi:hypothetical protein
MVVCPLEDMVRLRQPSWGLTPAGASHHPLEAIVRSSNMATGGIVVALLLLIGIGGWTVGSRPSRAPSGRGSGGQPSWRGRGGPDRSSTPRMGPGGSVQQQGKIEWVQDTRR